MSPSTYFFFWVEEGILNVRFEYFKRQISNVVLLFCVYKKKQFYLMKKKKNIGIVM